MMSLQLSLIEKGQNSSTNSYKKEEEEEEIIRDLTCQNHLETSL